MVWWGIAALAAYFVKGLCGFANTLVFTTMLSFGQESAAISPVELLLGYPGNLLLAWRERRAIRWRMCLPLMGLVLLGCVPGAFLLKNAGAGGVNLAFGLVIVLVGLDMLLRGSGPRTEQAAPWKTVLIGLVSGVLCGLYGVGALLGAYLSRVTEDSHAFKANLCMVFAVENTFRIALYLATGVFTAEAWRRAAVLLPVMLLGLWVGMKCSARLNEQAARRAVTLALIASGLALAATGLRAML